MEELVPLLEREGVTLNIDPHPDDFVEDGLEAWRIIRGVDTPAVGFVYVGSHTFHYGDRAASLIPQLGERLGAVYAADSFDHRRSHGLRYITNPPGNAVRVHQHLTIGDGDVDWTSCSATSARRGSSPARTRSSAPTSSPRTSAPTRSPRSSWRGSGRWSRRTRERVRRARRLPWTP